MHISHVRMKVNVVIHVRVPLILPFVRNIAAAINRVAIASLVVSVADVDVARAHVRAMLHIGIHHYTNTNDSPMNDVVIFIHHVPCF